MFKNLGKLRKLAPLSLFFRQHPANSLLVTNCHQFSSYTADQKIFPQKLDTVKLPVLKSIASKITPPDFSNAIFVCGQHLLSNVIPMFKQLQDWGTKKIFVVGKSYSTHAETAKKLEELGIGVQPTSPQLYLGNFSPAYIFDVTTMWHSCIKYIETLNTRARRDLRIIILDDGGVVLDHMPPRIKELNIPVIGKEQTASGNCSAENISCPVIEVFSTAIKSWFEPEWIAEQSLHELETQLKLVNKESKAEFSKKSVVGIIGLGRIGLETLKQCIRSGYTSFSVCDVDIRKRDHAVALIEKHYRGIKIEPTDNMWLVINSADIILGCVGKDILAGGVDNLRFIRMPKVFASLSSRDIEFNTLLRYIQKHNRNKNFLPHQTISFKNGFGEFITILKGGMPIGFTNASECVPTQMIQLIRGLELEALLQADEMLSNKNCVAASYMLAPERQLRTLEAWRKTFPPIAFEQMLKNKFVGKDEQLLRVLKTWAETSQLSEHGQIPRTKLIDSTEQFLKAIRESSGGKLLTGSPACTDTDKTNQVSEIKQYKS